ncbi:MAG: glycosyltransferase [Desulfosarcina sp.]|nr:glycosyltransferase [Desulfosarcina sp.]
MKPTTIAMLSIHSSPIGELGTRDTGGMSVYVRELAREMGSMGHQVDIFTHAWRDDASTVVVLAPRVRLVLLGISHSGPHSKAGLYAHADNHAAAIERFRRHQARTYDLIHSHYWLSGHVGRLLKKRWQRPHAITFHTLGAAKAETGVGAVEPTLRLAVEKELVLACDGLLAPCEGEKTNLMHYYGADAAKIAMVPGGVDLKRFRPMQKGPARRRLGLVSHGRLLLSIGRLTPQKGQDRIIEALPRIETENRPHLMVVGGNGDGDPERRRLQNIAAAAGVQEWVTFCGSVAHRDLPVYYAAADVFVQASHYESFGLVGLEALACGRPVVSTPVGLMAVLSRSQRPGIVVADGSPAELAAGILTAAARTADWPAPVIRQTATAFRWSDAASAALTAYRAAMQAEAAS